MHTPALDLTTSLRGDCPNVAIRSQTFLKVSRPQKQTCPHAPGGRLETGADATPPPQLSAKTCGGGPGRGGSWGGGGGGYWQLDRGGGGCTQPPTTTCIPQGGVWGHGGIEVCMR